MTTRAALTLTALSAALAMPAAAAAAASWSTGAYRGAASNVMSKERRGTVSFTVTRTRARLDRLSVVLRCTDGKRRTFTISDAGSGRLKPGPTGAGVSIEGRREIDGWDVDWDLVGGVKGSTFRGSVSSSALLDSDTENQDCTLIGSFRARRR